MNVPISYKQMLDKCMSWEYCILADGTIIYMSPSTERITGYPPEVFIAAPEKIQTIVHPDDRSIANEHISALTRPQEECRVEFRIIHANGGIRYISHYCTSVNDQAGRYIGRRVSNIDISEQKRAQWELVSREKDLELLLSTSSEGFFYMTLDEPVKWDDSVDKEAVLDYVFDHQRITRINQSMLNQYGAKEAEFVGLTVRQLFSHDVSYGKSVWRRFFDEGYLALQTREQKLDGTPMWIEGEYFCLYDDRGLITGHFGIQRDVTQAKEFTQQLTHLNERLREEIARARTIHRHLLPAKLPDIHGMDMDAFYRPALDIGGDFYDVLPLERGALLILADVSGHGLDGAMIAAFVKSAISTWIGTRKNSRINPADMLRFVAAQFSEMGYPDDYFACLFLGLVDCENDVIAYASTGFQTPLLLGHSAGIDELPLGGLPIASSVPLHLLNLNLHRVPFEPAAELFITTDGLTEANCGSNYYERRLQEVFGQGFGGSAADTCRHIQTDFDRFMHNQTIRDDVTFLVVKRT